MPVPWALSLLLSGGQFRFPLGQVSLAAPPDLFLSLCDAQLSLCDYAYQMYLIKAFRKTS